MEVTPVASTYARNLPMAPQVNGVDPIFTSAPAVGAATYRPALSCNYQLISGAAATAILEVSNEDATGRGVNNNWIVLATLMLTGAGTVAFVDPQPVPWRWIRARTTIASTPTYVLMGG